MAGSGGAGTYPGSSGTSALDSHGLTTGEETFSRLFATANGASLGSSGSLRLTYFTAKESETISQLRLISGTTAAGATPTLVRAGIYTEAANGDLTLVASIVNDTTIFAGASTAYTRSLSVALAKVAGTRYALGVIVVTGAAVPTVAGFALGTPMGAESGLAPRVAAAWGSQTDLPGSVPVGSLTSSTSMLYAALLP